MIRAFDVETGQVLWTGGALLTPMTFVGPNSKQYRRNDVDRQIHSALGERLFAYLTPVPEPTRGLGIARASVRELHGIRLR